MSAPSTELVHSPLEAWARTRGDAIAIDSGTQSLSFAHLYEAVEQRASALRAAEAPAVVLVDAAASLPGRLVDFLGIIASGRCAAVPDTDWTAPVMQRVQAAMPTAPSSVRQASPESAFYVGFTSGSTGTPKGFQRDHRSWVESFQVCLQDFGSEVEGRILAPGRDSHSLFLFGMLLGLWTGAGVVVQEHFSASTTLETLRQGHTPCLIAVPSQLLLVMELARHRNMAALPLVRLIMISGARWPRDRTDALQALFPNARIIEFYGASETSFITRMETDAAAPVTLVGRPFSNVELQIRDPDSAGVGMIYVRSPMVFSDYFLAKDSTAALRDGAWLSVRDLGRLDEQGRLHLTGRQSRMIVTQGKNLFAEELEAVLESHPAIALASVLGLPDPVRGAQVAAVIHWVDSTANKHPSALQIQAWCKQHLEPFKAPRKVWVCADWPYTLSGKTDHKRLEISVLEGLPCLHPLP